MKTTITKSLVIGLALSCFNVVDSNAYCYTAEDDYIYENIHYLFSQAQESPLWMEIVQHHDHSKLKSVVLPEIYALPDGTPDNAVSGRKGVFECIGYRAFHYSSLTDIKLPSTLKKISKEAFAGSDIKTIELPEGLEYIGDRAFSGCENLEEIKIPESIKYIGTGVFSFCGQLRKVEFPSTLQSLSGFTFRYSPVQDIICNATVPPVIALHDLGIIEAYFGDDIDRYGGPLLEDGECTLHVPAESVELYREAPVWNLFHKIVPIKEVGVSVEEIGENQGNISYRVENGVLTVDCNSGDSIAIYDADGICLLSEDCTQPRRVAHNGNGIRIIKLNGSSVKIVI